MSLVEVRVPELGDAKGVTVVDVLVKKGSEIRIDDPLITLETEKASMDVPSTVNGIVDSVALKKGDEVAAGALIATVQAAAAATPAPQPRLRRGGRRRPQPRRRARRHRLRPRRLSPHRLRPRQPDRQAAARRRLGPSIWWCWVRASAATPRRFARPIWVSRSRWSSAGRCWAACA